MLIPITIDLELPSEHVPGMRLKDRFLWNLNEPFLTPRSFAEILCNDLALGNAYIDPITDLVSSQIEESQAVAEIDVADEPTRSSEVDWAEKQVQPVDDEEEEQDWKEADQRIIVNVRFQRPS